MLRALYLFLFLFMVAVFLTVFFSDFLPLPLGNYASQRSMLSLLLAVVCPVVGAIWVVRVNWKGMVRGVPVIILSGLFILVSVPYGSVPYSWVEPGMYASFFLGFTLLGCFLAECRRSRQWAIILAYVAVLTSFFYGFVNLMIYCFALSEQAKNYSSYIPWGFINIRYWGHVATWLVPVFSLAAIIGPLQNQRLWRLICALAGALWWWIILVTAARGSIVGLVAGVLVVIVCFGRMASPWLKVFLSYFLYGLALWLLFSLLLPSLIIDDISLRGVNVTSSGRWPLFVEAWEMSLVNFPFGLGPQSWLTHEAITESYKALRRLGHPHNMYLMWAAEYGWLLIAGLMAMAVQAILFFWQRRTEVLAQGEYSSVLVLSGYTASVAAALTHAGVSAIFMAPGSMLVGFMVLCIFWGLISPSGGFISRYRRFSLCLVLAVFLMMACFGALWLREVANYYQAMVDDRDARYNGVIPTSVSPRFWRYGTFPRSQE
ncbi:MAG: O-antigen ligase family protein [Rickettsiales bacterium]